MKRLITTITILAVLSVALVGCGQAYAPNVPTDIPEDTPTDSSTETSTNGEVENTTDVTLHKEPAEHLTWISPGKVMVGNFYPGARAEWELLLHNGDSTATDMKLVTTERGESSCPIILNSPLHGSPSDISISSDCEADDVWTSGYKEDIQELLIEGLSEDQERILTITYSCIATYEVKYRHPDHVEIDKGYVKATEEVKDWVIIADPTPVLMPRETREILVVLAMPEDAAVFAPKWEFWVSVIDVTGERPGGGTVVRTELCSRWLVTMR